MEWTPEAINAEIAYRTADQRRIDQLRAVQEGTSPRWWQRLLHRSHDEADDGHVEGRAA
jgi:hypothetical protein